MSAIKIKTQLLKTASVINKFSRLYIVHCTMYIFAGTNLSLKLGNK